MAWIIIDYKNHILLGAPPESQRHTALERAYQHLFLRYEHTRLAQKKKKKNSVVRSLLMVK